jgi:glutaminyl-peptide cyclotransferase
MFKNKTAWIVGIIVFAMVAPFFLKFLGNLSNERTVEPPLPPAKVAYPEVKATFNADAAYALTEKLLTFGQRHFDTKGHEAVRQWLVSELKTRGATVLEQPFKAKTPAGKETNGTNLIASYNLANPKRILFAVHWDSRHIGDRDEDPKFQKEPILGADDAGTGVSILLEMAAMLQKDSSHLGVDLIFFDAEDWGTSQTTESWCQGSQYWSRTPHAPSYKPKHAILLDMVGAKNARFPKEQISTKYASRTVENVWKTARQLGYMQLFVDEPSRDAVIDDHKFVNEIAQIPMIDIINYPADRFLGEYHHTHLDSGMSHIDKSTIRAVGQTLWHFLHYDNAGVFEGD